MMSKEKCLNLWTNSPHQLYKEYMEISSTENLYIT